MFAKLWVAFIIYTIVCSVYIQHKSGNERPGLADHKATIKFVLFGLIYLMITIAISHTLPGRAILRIMIAAVLANTFALILFIYIIFFDFNMLNPEVILFCFLIVVFGGSSVIMIHNGFREERIRRQIEIMERIRDELEQELANNRHSNNNNNETNNPQ